ncbi:MAG: hypothetical protein ACTSO8_01470 [Promethearchaeota archaeon]
MISNGKRKTNYINGIFCIFFVYFAIVVLITSILFCSSAFLIPGILSLLGKKIGVMGWYYALIPVTLLWMLIYTMVIAILFPTSFISNFQGLLGVGIIGSVVLAIVVLCATYEKMN